VHDAMLDRGAPPTTKSNHGGVDKGV
jgi:hypothetical protein